MEELVSVIITTYKGNYSLKRAINSLLEQTYKNIEIIVVDDNDPNTSGRAFTEKLMKEFVSNSNIKYIKHSKNLNGATARNTGIKNSLGKYIGFLDDDDFYVSNKIEKCVDFFKRNIEYDSVICGVIRTTKKGFVSKLTIPNIASENQQKEMLLNKSLLGSGSNLFFTKESINNIGFFDEAFVRHQDVEFMIRYLASYKVGILDEFLVIQSSNGINNIPNYYKFKETKKMFFEKFHNEIELLSESEKKNFFSVHYTELFRAACKYGKKERLYAINELKNIRKIKLKDYLVSIIINNKLLYIISKKIIELLSIIKYMFIIKLSLRKNIKIIYN